MDDAFTDGLTQTMASIAPAPPKAWPIIDLVEWTGVR